MIVRAVLLLGFLLFDFAHAFVPSPSYVLGKWAARSGNIESVHVKQKTTIFDASFPGGTVTVDDEIRIKRPALYRRTLHYPQGNVDLYLGAQRAFKMVQGKVEAASLAETLGPIGVLFTYDETRRLAAALRQMSVDVDVSRWVISDQDVRLEIGALAGARFSFSKNDWIPRRAEISGRKYVLNASTPSRWRFPYADSIEVWAGDRLAEKSETVSVDVNVVFAKDMFDVPKPAAALKKP